MTQVILIGAVVLAAYCVSLLKWPFRPCRKCLGKGTNRGSSRKRWGPCSRCGGSKQVRRIGATAVHRFFWSVLGSAARERRKERLDRGREKAGGPE